jgi:hypothetical protein
MYQGLHHVVHIILRAIATENTVERERLGCYLFLHK